MRVHPYVAVAVVVLVAGLSARCSDSGSTSSPAAQAPPAAAAPGDVATLEGYHDITNCNGIMGWAWDRSKPSATVSVDLYDNDVRFATVAADALRPDLAAAGKGDGRHGFSVPTPASLKDGRLHRIYMKFGGTTVDLRNGPKEITCQG